MKFKIPNSLNLTRGMTPLIPLDNTFEKSPEYRVWLKRDDFTGIELSGNKVRKLDFLLAEAIDNGARHIVTCGGIQSNHCRTAVYMARKMQLECTLFLRGRPEINPTGNLLLNLLAGAQLHYVTPEEYQNIDNIMSNFAEKRAKENDPCYVIPEGGSNATGAWGYATCFMEIMDQIAKYHLKIDAVAVATGSGGTHAGLLIGKTLSSSDIDIISINVCDTREFFVQKIKRIIREFEDKYTVVLNIAEDEIHITDGFVGEGYGKLNPEASNLLTRFVRREGIILDPVYSAKAFFGLKTMIDDGSMPYKNVLFIHTGGIFGIFPAAADLTM